jgi:hypothetical protein
VHHHEASAAAGKKKTRGLWGDGKGQFRTATVRGTVWFTEGRCDRTLTKVKRGVVEVRDVVKRKTILVKGREAVPGACQAAIDPAQGSRPT